MQNYSLFQDPSPSPVSADIDPDRRYRPPLESHRWLWERYAQDAEKEDEKLAVGWVRNLDNLALFAGLFSAVTTAFIIESLQLMQPDFNELNFRATVAAAAGRPLPDDSFTVPFSARAVNCIWIASLLLSLSSALIALMGKDWVAEYRSGFKSTVHPLAWAELRTYRLLCIRRWRMSEIIAAAPSLLHLSLITFAVGLVIFIFPIDFITALLASALISASGVLYAIIGLSPVIWPSSPFRTPVTNYYRSILLAAWESSTILGLRSLVHSVSALLVALHVFLTRPRGLHQLPPSTAPVAAPAPLAVAPDSVITPAPVVVPGPPGSVQQLPPTAPVAAPPLPAVTSAPPFIAPSPLVASAPPEGVASTPARNRIGNALLSFRRQFQMVPVLFRDARDVEASPPTTTAHNETSLLLTSRALSFAPAPSTLPPAAATPIESAASSDTLWDRMLAGMYSVLEPGSRQVRHAAGLTRGNAQGISVDRWVVPTSDCAPSLRAEALAWLDAHSPLGDVRRWIIGYIVDPDSGAAVAPHILSSHPQLRTRIHEEMESSDFTASSMERIAQCLLAANRLRLHVPALTSAVHTFLHSVDNGLADTAITDDVILALCILRPGFTMCDPLLLRSLFERAKPSRSTRQIVLNSMRDHGRSSNDACDRAIFMFAEWKDGVLKHDLDSIEILLQQMLPAPRPAHHLPGNICSYPCSENSPKCRIVDLLSAFLLQPRYPSQAIHAALDLLADLSGDHRGKMHACAAAALTSPTASDLDDTFLQHDLARADRILATIHLQSPISPNAASDVVFHVSIARLVVKILGHSPAYNSWDIPQHISAHTRYVEAGKHSNRRNDLQSAEGGLSHSIDELFRSLTGVKLKSDVYTVLCNIFADGRHKMLGAIHARAWISIASFLCAQAHSAPNDCAALADQLLSCREKALHSFSWPGHEYGYDFAEYVAGRAVCRSDVSERSNLDAVALFDCLCTLRSVYPSHHCWREVATLVGAEAAEFYRNRDDHMLDKERLRQFYTCLGLSQPDYTFPPVEDLGMPANDQFLRGNEISRPSSPRSEIVRSRDTVDDITYAHGQAMYHVRIQEMYDATSTNDVGQELKNWHSSPAAKRIDQIITQNFTEAAIRDGVIKGLSEEEEQLPDEQAQAQSPNVRSTISDQPDMGLDETQGLLGGGSAGYAHGEPRRIRDDYNEHEEQQRGMAADGSDPSPAWLERKEAEYEERAYEPPEV